MSNARPGSTLTACSIRGKQFTATELLVVDEVCLAGVDGNDQLVLFFRIGSRVFGLEQFDGFAVLHVGYDNHEMIRSTNTTSTSGVTLISGFAPPPPLPALRLTATVKLHVVEQLARCVLHFHVELVETRTEIVEDQHGTDRDH